MLLIVIIAAPRAHGCYSGIRAAHGDGIQSAAMRLPFINAATTCVHAGDMLSCRHRLPVAARLSVSGLALRRLQESPKVAHYLPTAEHLLRSEHRIKQQSMSCEIIQPLLPMWHRNTSYSRVDSRFLRSWGDAVSRHLVRRCIFIDYLFRVTGVV